MTLLGKVFTYMLFVISVGFFILALMVNATHINYRNQVEDPANGFKVRVDRATAKNQSLTEELERTKSELAIEQAARRSALAALQTQLEQLSSDLATKEATLSNLQSQLTQLAATEQLTQQELAARTKDNELLRQQIVAAREDRNAQYQSYVQTLGKMVSLQGEFNTLKSAKDYLADQYTKADQKLQILGITPETKLDGPPPVNGQITAVTSNMVEVSIGKDDGIRAGHTLDVYRGGQYLGRLKVTRSEDNRAIAEILSTYQKGFMKAGDRVDSRLSDMYQRPVTTP